MNEALREARQMEDRDMKKEHEYTNQQLLQHHQITIRFLSVGCVVSVGCKEIPFGNNEAAMNAIKDYIKNPKESSEHWNKIFNQ